MEVPCPHLPDPVENAGGRPPCQRLFWELGKDAKFIAKMGDQPFVLALDRLRPRLNASALGDDLLQRDQGTIRNPPRRVYAFCSIGEISNPMQDAKREGFSTHGAKVLSLKRILRREDHPARTMSIVMILPLLGIELDRSQKSFRVTRFECGDQPPVARLRQIEQGHLPSELGRRMGVRARDQYQIIEGGDTPIHRRIARQPGLDGEDPLDVFTEARFEGIEPRSRAENGEPGRPDMGGDDFHRRLDVPDDLDEALGR